jgi:hypothetical protein
VQTFDRPQKTIVVGMRSSRKRTQSLENFPDGPDSVILTEDQRWAGAERQSKNQPQPLEDAKVRSGLNVSRSAYGTRRSSVHCGNDFFRILVKSAARISRFSVISVYVGVFGLHCPCNARRRSSASASPTGRSKRPGVMALRVASRSRRFVNPLTECKLSAVGAATVQIVWNQYFAQGVERNDEACRCFSEATMTIRDKRSTYDSKHPIFNCSVGFMVD